MEDIEQMEKIEDIDEIEKIFNSEIREKKVTGRGIFSRASRKKGFKGSMMLPFDNLDNKQKRRFIKSISGKVDMYNMYDDLSNLVDYPHFKLMHKDERKQLFEKFLERHTIEEIAIHWGVNKSVIFDLRYRLGLTKKTITIPKGENTEMLDEHIIENHKQTIITYDQFKALDKPNKRAILEKYLELFQFDRNALAKAWGVKVYSIYDACKLLGLSQPRGQKSRTETSSIGKPLNKTYNKRERVVKDDMEKTTNTVNKQNFFDDFEEMDTFIVNQGSKDITGEELEKRILEFVEQVKKDKKYKYRLYVEKL